MPSDLAMIIIKVAVWSWEGLLHCKQDQFKVRCALLFDYFLISFFFQLEQNLCNKKFDVVVATPTMYLKMRQLQSILRIEKPNPRTGTSNNKEELSLIVGGATHDSRWSYT